MARILPNGELDVLYTVGSGPGSYTSSSIKDIELMSDNKAIVAGAFSTFSGIARSGMVKLFTNGTVDLSFTAPSISGINCIRILPDNKILVGGSFTTVGGITKKGIAKLNINGSLDATFNLGLGGTTIYDMDYTPDNKIIIVGSFTTFDGIPRSKIARLFANGSIDTTFNPGTGGNSTIDFVDVRPDGKILISGLITTYNGIAIPHIAVLSADGQLDTIFNNGAGSGFSSGFNVAAYNSMGDLLAGTGAKIYNGKKIDGIVKINGPGCNSIYDTTYVEIFEGDSYTLVNGEIVTASGIYSVATDLIFDCDVVNTVVLTVVPFPCNTPDGVVVSNITTNSSKISWVTVPGATQYNIWYRKVGEPAWTKKNVTANFKTLTGLLPASTYQYKVRTKCTDEYSDFTPINSFTTLPLKTAVTSNTPTFLAYPNPSSGNFNISVDGITKDFELNMYNIAGQIIWTSHFSNMDEQIEVQVNELPVGFYTIVLTSAEAVITQKICIQ